ncbi:MAG: hypothetical protein KA267_06105 [Gemmatimonadales bacterium]|nr:hypothetical protein [Gemmatimonadales bacterium]
MGTPYDTPSLDDHPQAIFERGERIDSDSVWIEWTERVEALLGHSLDGNDPDYASENRPPDSGDGYSLDEALEWHDRGLTPEYYAANVQHRRRYAAGRQACRAQAIETAATALVNSLERDLGSSEGYYGGNCHDEVVALLAALKIVEA